LGESNAGGCVCLQAIGVKPRIVVSLLEGYGRRLKVGSVLLVPSGLLVLFGEQIAGAIEFSAWSVQLLGAIVFFLTLLALAQGGKCPSCRTNLLYYAIGNTPGGNWLEWLRTVDKCPKCGFASRAEDRR
jgi:hypothetical protein